MQAEDHVDYDALFDAAFDAPSVKAVIEGKVRVVGVNGAAFDIFPPKCDTSLCMSPSSVLLSLQGSKALHLIIALSTRTRSESSVPSSDPA